MPEPVRMTLPVTRVLAALLDDPDEPRYGLDLMTATGLPSGTLYPILTRLHAAGWLRTEWEDIDPSAAGRPARRYYLLSPDGLVAARQQLAELYEQLRPATRPGHPRTATDGASA